MVMPFTGICMAQRVLIIDDEENIRQMLRLTLETSGYEVCEASDGMEAFAILGSDSQWDLILLDQRMPGLEGTEVLRRLKVLAPSSPVVMLTAFASVELAVEAMKLGATDFLRKPMTPETVRNAVSAAKYKSTRSKEVTKTEAQVTHVTMNGFTILRTSDAEGGKPNERRFLVQRPDGSGQEVVIEIAVEALRSVDQIAHGASVEKSFWTDEAETFLSDFIWNDGDVPATGRMVLNAVEPSNLRKLVHSHEQTSSDN